MIGAGRKFGALVAVALATLALAAAAQADFGIKAFDVQIAAKPPASVTETTTSTVAGAYTQAGGHPYAIVTHVEWNNHPDTNPEFPGRPTPDGDIKNTEVDLPLGLLGNPAAIPQCTAQQLIGRGVLVNSDFSECPTDSEVGTLHLQLNVTGSGLQGTYTVALFNMVAPTGVPARFGFNIAGNLVYLDAVLREDDYGITVGPHNAPQALRVVGSDIVFWGIPADSRHDLQRCNGGFDGTPTDSHCPGSPGEDFGPHSSGIQAVPLLTMPTSCTEPGVGQPWTIRTDSWENPGVFDTETIFNHLPPYAPEESAPGPQEGTTGCGKVPFSPDLSVSPTQQSAGSPTGLSVRLKFPTDGLLNPDGISQSHLKKAVVTLPEGVTINPSQAEGLGVCTPAQYAQETLKKAPGQGCPSTSKIGTVEVHTPVLAETLDGNVYVAQSDDPRTSAAGAENPFDSLIALYIVIRNQERGVVVKLPGKVEPDPNTGKIRTVFDDLPQVPFSEFEFRFREGPRAPLVTPSKCGSFATEAQFYPWARPNTPVNTTPTFQITSGVGGGSCPGGGVPPFKPGFTAGTLNNNAGSYSPFYMRLTRSDGEQDMTKFSAVLPPGVSAKIAGVSQCPDSAIALAKAKTGREELASSSCPANSEIGHILAGAGVGSSLVYVPGKMYLGGPFAGAPLSAIVITPAVAGPFDVGTVITREALTLDPRTAEVHVDGDKSDPIPHILAGIPLAVRDIRVYVDRPNFTINPTSCDPFQVGGTLFGSFLDVLSPADDVPVPLASRFQAANCLNLGFKPRLSLRLRGGTRRGAFPALRAELRPRPGDANLSGAVVTLPRSAFLEQGHIRTICTRVQYAAKACPQGSIYGHVTAFTPLLDQPLEGPVYLRSSDHNLPDLVMSLHGIVDVEAIGRIDSIRGRIRSSFEAIPDAPISKVILTMQGGKKGLIVNSRDLCGKTPKANAEFTGQNGKAHDFHPALKSACRKATKRHNHKHKQR